MPQPPPFHEDDPYSVPPPPPEGWEWVVENGRWRLRRRPGNPAPPQDEKDPGLPPDHPDQHPDKPKPPGTGTGSGNTGPYGPKDGGWDDGGGKPWYQPPAWESANYEDPGPFDPGPAFSFREFTAPDPNDINNPAYKFRLEQGLKALQASKAGQGSFLSGATGKAMQDYGQQSASQEYNNIWNRSMSEYDTNRNNAFGNWAAQYGQRKDVYGFHFDNIGRKNTFNQNNAFNKNSFNLTNAKSAWDDLFGRWAKKGDWLADIAKGGND